jgi:hypothetical protein
MKMHSIRVANAFAISQGILGVICAFISYVAPNFVINIAKSLPHSLDISPLVPATPRTFAAGEFFLGLVAWMLIAWISGWLLAVVYNGLTASAPAGSIAERSR